MWKWTQRTFAGGQQDLTLAGRQDLATYFTSARTLENFLVKRQGCISKRRGTELVADLENVFNGRGVVTHARAIPFIYERDGGYTLLFIEGDLNGNKASHIFICSNEGILTKVTRKKAGTVTPSAPSTGSNEYQWRDTPYFFETVVLDEETGEAEEVSGVPVMVDIPYVGEVFNDIGYTQSGDTLFIAHKKYPFATLKRKSGVEFVFTEVNFQELGASVQYYPPLITATKSGTEGASGGAERTISYVATYVKDGVESAPCRPVHIKYTMPWTTSFAVKIETSKGDNEEDPDVFNVYKRTSGEYGYIGSTQKVVEQVVPTASSYSYLSVGQYLLDRDNRYEVSPIEFSTSSQASFKKTLFNYGNRFAYSGTNQALRGGILGTKDSLTKGIVIALSAGTPFTDIEILCGLSSYLDSSMGNFKVGDYWSYASFLHFTPLEAKTLQVEIAVTVKVGGSSKSKTFTSEVIDVPVAVGPKQTCLVEDYRGSTSVTQQGKVSQVYNQQLVSYSFADAINADIDIKTEGATWYVTKITIKAFDADGNGVAPILSYINCSIQKTDANYTNDDNITPDISLTPPKNEPIFDKDGEYPSSVAINNQRMVLASTSKMPFSLWMSTVGDLYNFNTHASIREDDAIEATIPATEFPQINHVVAAKNLVLLCDNGEWIVKPTSGNTISYKTIEIKQQSQIGCSKRLPPLPVADELIFCESTNETLRSMAYDWTSDGYKTQDLSVLSQSLTRNNPIVDYAYKQHPDSIIVCVLADGTLATLTYMKEHEVCAWSTARLGGGLKAVGICTDKAIRGGTTDLYILATDASGVYSLLRVREDSPAATVEESLCLDAMRTVEVAKDATEVPSIPNGMVAYDLADGTKADTLSAGHAYAMGYPFEAVFRSVTPEAQGESTIQFELKGAKSAELRLENASAFKVVPSALEGESDVNYWSTCGDDVEVVDGKVTYGAQDHFVALAGDANTSGAITIKSDSPWPMSLLSYSINFEFDPRLLGQNG